MEEVIGDMVGGTTVGVPKVVSHGGRGGEVDGEGGGRFKLIGMVEAVVAL